jgi:hypothetical protein
MILEKLPNGTRKTPITARAAYSMFKTIFMYLKNFPVCIGIFYESFLLRIFSKIFKRKNFVFYIFWAKFGYDFFLVKLFLHFGKFTYKT